MERHGGMILTRKDKELGEKPVPMLLVHQFPHGLARG
jgi:hypothetical protein